MSTFPRHLRSSARSADLVLFPAPAVQYRARDFDAVEPMRPSPYTPTPPTRDPSGDGPAQIDPAELRVAG